MICKKRFSRIVSITLDNGVIIPPDEYKAKVCDEIRPIVKAEVFEEIRYRKKLTEKQRRFYEASQNRTNFQKFMLNEYGTFFFTNYIEILELLVDVRGDFDGALAFRFIYLSTYMDYDNKLKWGKGFRGKYTGYMNTKDLSEVMGLSKNHIAKFKNRLIESGLIIVTDGGVISINKKYCRKGKLVALNKRNSIRSFEHGIQELYKSSTAKEHKRLGVLVQLLPYLNFNHNVLCWNPEENIPERLEVLTIQDICRIVGKSVAHARRFEGEMFKISVGGNYLIGKFRYYSCTEAYVINPALFYKGNNIDALKGLSNLFLLMNNEKNQYACG